MPQSSRSAFRQITALASPKASSACATKANREPSTIGVYCGHGRGERAGRSTISKPIRRSTPNAVALEGHSRYGKATLVTMAYDPRLAIAFVSSSGEGGAKLHRRDWGEIVENIAGSGEYHWMAGNFIKYAGPLNWNDLPVDSHELIALCAPRPVFISAGTKENGDGWVDAKGSFLAAVGAGPAYELLGKKGLGTTEFPPVETTLIDGDVGFRQHSAGHTPGPNWPTFLTFAERYFDNSPVDSIPSPTHNSN